MHLRSRKARLDYYGHEAGSEGSLPAAELPHRPPNLSAAWQICGKFMADAFFAEPRAATSPSRVCRKENLRKLLCLNVAARLVSAVYVRIGHFRLTQLKAFAAFRILCWPARQSRSASSRMRHKCLSGRRISQRTCAACPAMRRKRFTCHAFRFVRALRGRELPSVCRNACLKFAARLVISR
jgi:hypothetical protein